MGRLLALTMSVVAALPLGPAPAQAVSTACDARPATEIPADARIGTEWGGPTRFLGDVDGDGRRDVVTGYMRGGVLAEDRDSYLQVELASGWGTQFQIDSVDDYSLLPMAEPTKILAIGGRRLIVAAAGGNAVGAYFAFFELKDCSLVPVQLVGAGTPEIWSGGGLMHMEWFSCRANDVVMLDLHRGLDGNGEVVPDVMIGGEARVFRLESGGFRQTGTLALHLPRTVGDLERQYPHCGGFVGTFVDDDGSVFEGPIEWMAVSGITKGCNPPANDRYCPTDRLTRGQMAAFLVRALDLPSGGGGDRFEDDDGSPFEGAIDKLAAAGVTKGCNPPANDRFCPDRRVTRGEMAAFLVRALGLPSGGGRDRFVDDDGHVFEAAIDRLAAAGITAGCNPPANDRYCPDDHVTRGQMAAFLKRATGE